MATRITITITAILRKRPSDPDEGELLRQLAATKHATAPMSRSRNGFGSDVCMAATDKHAAQAHQANGCTGRGTRLPFNDRRTDIET
jgi:hypothetical protein